MQQYLDAVREVLDKGTRKENRTGVDTISTFNVNYEIDLRQGFPLLTTKKINWKNIVAENLWFISGEPHIAILKKHGCKFWDAWADKNGFVPSPYGSFWRSFPTQGFGLGASHRHLSNYVHADFNDQFKWVIDEIKKNPMSRRLVVSAWYPANGQQSKLPPCHLLFIFNVQNMQVGQTEDGKPKYEQHLCLHLTQRSCDMALGVPYNIAGYALILEIVSRLTGLRAGIFAHTLVDAHIYTKKPDGDMAEYDHIPGLQEQLTRTPKGLPRLRISDEIKTLADIEKLYLADTDTLMSKFVLEGYDPYEDIRFKVAV